MPYYRYREWDICPHCRKRVSEVREGLFSDTTIGPELTKCPHCGGIYKTRKSEWADKSESDKKAYHKRVIWWCVGAAFWMAFGAFIVTALIMWLIIKATLGQILLASSILAMIVGIFAVKLVLRNSQNEIKKSLERTSKAHYTLDKPM